MLDINGECGPLFVCHVKNSTKLKFRMSTGLKIENDWHNNLMFQKAQVNSFGNVNFCHIQTHENACWSVCVLCGACQFSKWLFGETVLSIGSVDFCTSAIIFFCFTLPQMLLLVCIYEWVCDVCTKFMCLLSMAMFEMVRSSLMFVCSPSINQFSTL